MLAVLRSDRNGKHSTFLLVRGTLHPIHANPLEVVVLLSLYLAVLDDQSNEEQFIDGLQLGMDGGSVLDLSDCPHTVFVLLQLFAERSGGLV